MPWIRIKDIATSDLSSHDKIEVIADALEQTALAEAFRIIHGNQWAKRYKQAGGLMRLTTDPEPEPCIWTEHNTAQAVQVTE